MMEKSKIMLLNFKKYLEDLVWGGEEKLKTYKKKPLLERIMGGRIYKFILIFLFAILIAGFIEPLFLKEGLASFALSWIYVLVTLFFIYWLDHLKKTSTLLMNFLFGLVSILAVATFFSFVSFDGPGSGLILFFMAAYFLPLFSCWRLFQKSSKRNIN